MLKVEWMDSVGSVRTTARVLGLCLISDVLEKPDKLKDDPKFVNHEALVVTRKLSVRSW